MNKGIKLAIENYDHDILLQGYIPDNDCSWTSTCTSAVLNTIKTIDVVHVIVIMISTF